MLCLSVEVACCARPCLSIWQVPGQIVISRRIYGEAGILLAVALRTCSVTVADSRGIRHAAEVQAETLFEAAVLGLQILKKDGWIADIMPDGIMLAVRTNHLARRQA
jgi:hypothetical protein